MESTPQQRPDRLSLIMAIVCAIGILVAGWFVLRWTAPALAATVKATECAELPADCPVPKAGEQLQIRIEVHNGKLDVACNTLRPFVPMRGAQ